MPIPRTCHGWLTHSLTFHRKWTRCYSQQYTAEGLNKLADREDGVGAVGEYRQMNKMMNIRISFVSELLAAPCFARMLWFVIIQFIHNMIGFLIGFSTHPVMWHFSIWVNKPLNRWSLCRARGRPGPSLLLLLPGLLVGNMLIWQSDVHGPTESQCAGETDDWVQKNTTLRK